MVVFTKKGDGVHGTVKWVGVYRYTVSRKEYSVKSVGVETVSQSGLIYLFYHVEYATLRM